jgi:hypothetical protein
MPDLAHLTEPLRSLLKKNTVFLWLLEHKQAFIKVKEALMSPLVVCFFDPSLPTELLMAVSRHFGLMSNFSLNDRQSYLSLNPIFHSV